MRHKFLAFAAAMFLSSSGASVAYADKKADGESPKKVAAKVEKKIDPKLAEKIEYGQYLSGSCVACHQLSGAANGIPAIVGWDAEDFVEVLKSYKSKERENKAMQTVVATMSKDEMEALAAYFTTIKPKDE